VVTASLAPGATPPVVRLAKNRTTAIIITDMTGQPWPIINYDGLSDEDFTVKRLDNPAPDGYVLSVTPKGAFVSGNLEIVLKGLPSPISIDFVSAQKEVDARKEIRVQAKGPNTQFTTIGMPESLDTTLLSILQGVAPQGAKSLTVSSAAVQAWLSRDGSSMYLRTRYKIMSPAFENVTSSPDGTFAYKMVPVPVVLYKASEGRFGEFSVDGF
jgi:intracellular multiplication protein IcmK